MRYMKAEKVDMIFVCGECRQIREAVRLYTERFPDRIHPSFSIFIKKRIKKATNNRNSTNILAAIALNPHISTRQLERESVCRRQSVLRIFHSNKFHPFHISFREELHDNDFQNRVQFCEWALQRLQEDDMVTASDSALSERAAAAVIWTAIKAKTKISMGINRRRRR
ncbi:hypothetical protein ALC56_04036 [Trachymyrmex septentrionalis]|uniref:DUF4817 domain-containing protein n=1 Tax=Trachymyrmex septentrionalis TaxID=34720 RepID=A0A151JYP7_9HYME|nr:hypothetical protein ALC56_04036 [Trachymyrmex septentrionalis]